jgi:hypothetical protein
MSREDMRLLCTHLLQLGMPLFEMRLLKGMGQRLRAHAEKVKWDGDHDGNTYYYEAQLKAEEKTSESEHLLLDSYSCRLDGVLGMRLLPETMERRVCCELLSALPAFQFEFFKTLGVDMGDEGQISEGLPLTKKMMLSLCLLSTSENYKAVTAGRAPNQYNIPGMVVEGEVTTLKVKDLLEQALLWHGHEMATEVLQNFQLLGNAYALHSPLRATPYLNTQTNSETGMPQGMLTNQASGEDLAIWTTAVLIPTPLRGM